MALKFKVTKSETIQARLNGVDLIRVNYLNQKNATKSDVIKFMREMTKTMWKNNVRGKLILALKSKNVNKWVSSTAYQINQSGNINIKTDEYDDNQDDSPITDFCFYLIRDPKVQAGGFSNQNDCLYYALKHEIGDSFIWKHPTQLKKFLGLTMTEKVPIEMIPTLEAKLKINIHVSGDCTLSNASYPKTIHILFNNGHFYNDKKRSHKTLNRYFNFNEKPFKIYKLSDAPLIQTYDGSKVEFIEKKVHFKLIRDFKQPYTYVEGRKGKTTTIQQDYKEYIEMADLLKKESNDMINLYKTGSFINTSIYLFQHFNKVEAEHISYNESQWISRSSHGGMVWNIKTIGDFHSYDFVSKYPSILSDHHFMIPIKQGSIQTIQSLPDILKYGIYRCKISNIDSKLFKQNNNGYYTHIDIYHARKNNATIDLILDNEPNCLIYSRDKLVTSNQIFKEFVDFLFPLKQKKIKGAKPILNIIWGSLSEKNKKTKTVGRGEEPILKRGIDQSSSLKMLKENPDSLFPIYDFKPNQEIYKAMPECQGDSITFLQPDQMYKYNYARLKPFLLAKARTDIVNVFKPYLEHIIRVSTDGFMSRVPIEYKNIGNEMGQLRYDGLLKNVENIDHRKPKQLISEDNSVRDNDCGYL